MGEGEAGCLSLESGDIREGLQEDDLSVLVWIHGGKSFHMEGFKTTMERSWHCGSFSIQRYDATFFQVFFALAETLEYVLHNGP